MKKYTSIVISLLFGLNAIGQTIEKIAAKDVLEIVVSRDTINTIMIDGRSAEMFADTHIEGAVNIDAFSESSSIELKNYIDKEEFIVYCSNNKRGGIIIEKLIELEYKGKIIFIADGINGWNLAEYKTVSSKKQD
ncbi:rhodanese-like domain-containing protein [Lutibacter sp. A80]|uniref:rhodanese-like domain-containing protein n=1 Tax=Lutibacter sp. A80 TaxID=2918453 RepID=UPI001F070241|nr:rhodanese-like domain-containing protein [Lutibacter sp. A80]UMB59765.1 rhodanese-like domain-containing protein [Lutibacter sp. A80]